MGCIGNQAKAIIVFAIVGLSGCVQRTMTLNTSPPGALVWMNGQELGRTPLTRDFTWYGVYEVEVRKEGYEPLFTKTEVIAPWWQWPPMDLLAEFWPGRLKDQRHYAYALKPASTQPVPQAEIIARAGELSGKLESSRYTRAPATQPTTRAGAKEAGLASTRPATPTTRPMR